MEVEANLILMSGGWKEKLGGSPFKSISSRNDFLYYHSIVADAIAS